MMDILIVGNKSDLDKEISTDEGKAFAEFHNLEFVETSAKFGENV
jgi:hypothetical protein